MKVILTTGHAHSGFDQVHAILEHAGVSPGRMIPSAPNSTILSDRSATSAKSVVEGWNTGALSIFAANSEQDFWGWAQESSSVSLDCWSEFDPSVHFVLVYSSPAFAMAHSIGLEQTTPTNIKSCVESWLACNEDLLRFYHRHQEKCVLVNITAALYSASKLIDQIAILTASPLGLHSGQIAEESFKSSLVATSLASPLVAGYRRATAIYLELESLAHLPADQPALVAQESTNAWNEFLSVQLELQSAQRALLKLDDLSAESSLRVSELTAKLTDQLSLITNLESELLQARNLQSECVAKSSALEEENDLLRAESDLLFAQLQQVQEEIDTITKSDVETVVVPQLKTEILVDMCGEIDGENWYYAEHDGRWAGPAAVSTLRVPMLQDGDYQVRLDVVDSKDKKILANTTVQINGMPLTLLRNGRGVSALVTSTFSTAAIPQGECWEFKFGFPRLISPIEHGSSDSRMLAIRLRSLQIVRI